METAAHESRSNGSISGVKRPRSELDGESSAAASGGGGGGGWTVKASRESHDCINPVRSCEEKYFRDAMEKRDMTKSLIKLSIGEYLVTLKSLQVVNMVEGWLMQLLCDAALKSNL